MIPGSKQHKVFREFCREKRFQPHKSLPLFHTGPDEPTWILYRHGTKHPQPMKDEREIFAGWTFSKSAGNASERELSKCVCLHCGAYEAVSEEVYYVRRSIFEKWVPKIKAKRIYIPKNAKRDAFDPARQQLLKQLKQTPVFG